MTTDRVNSRGPSIAPPPNLRKYGAAPFRIAVVHGGPGGAGELAPVAREIGRHCGVLEPLQTAHSAEGQLEELSQLLMVEAEIPTTLIGHSWGAWLSVMLAARSPHLVAKLVLVASGPFTAAYAAEIEPTRRARLNATEMLEVERIESAFESATAQERNELFSEYAALSVKTDSYSLIQAPTEILPGGASIFQDVWPEAAAIRNSGQLLAMAKDVTCPVIAIHGDYDPHPVAGVAQPLSESIKDFEHVVLQNCGHTPWLERHAREAFYAVLARELAGD